MSSLDQRIGQIFREIFDDEALALSDSTTVKDIPEWDSFAHVKLMIAFEEAFNVNFTTDEVVTISSVGALKRALLEKGVSPE